MERQRHQRWHLHSIARGAAAEERALSGTERGTCPAEVRDVWSVCLLWRFDSGRPAADHSRDRSLPWLPGQIMTAIIKPSRADVPSIDEMNPMSAMLERYDLAVRHLGLDAGLNRTLSQPEY